MGILDFINKDEDLVLVDIGSTTIKVLEVSKASGELEITNIAIAQVTDQIFNNNVLQKPEHVVQKLSALLEENGFKDKRVATILPGPTVFTKIIKMPKMDLNQLDQSIQFEAARFLHDNSSTVKVDYHIMNEVGGSLEILVVVVKSNILDSFTDCFAACGLQTAIVDVDYFALQNCYETIYPQDIDRTVCLINVGARYSSVNICRGGSTLYSGSIAVGGNLFTSSLAAALGVDNVDAERLKKGEASAAFSREKVEEVLKTKVDAVASDFNRQLGLFWNSAGIDGGIDKIVLAGGGALTPGLLERLKEKTGVETMLLDFSEHVRINEKFDVGTVKELAPVLACLFGLASRKPGDKEIPDYL